jgi:hypothetical protein
MTILFTRMKQQLQNPLDRVFEPIFALDSPKPFGLPVFKRFLAPPAGVKFDGFFRAYQASGWNLEQSLKPYEGEELIEMCVFYDAKTSEFKFCQSYHYLGLNGIHFNVRQCDDAE